MKSTGRLDQGCIMEIHKRAFYSFDLDEQASLLSFNWTEKLAGMTDDDYKQALDHSSGTSCGLIRATLLSEVPRS